jgi:replicative DNA helicase
MEDNPENLSNGELQETDSLRSGMADAFKVIEGYSKGESTGVPTGFRDLDTITAGGFHPGELIILGGVAGAGKTSLALSFTARASLDFKKACLYVSTKDTTKGLTQRILNAQAGVNGFLLRTGRLPQRDYPKLSLAVGPLSTAPIEFYCQPRTQLRKVVEVARSLREQGRLELLVVDHLQMVLVNPQQQNKYEDVTIVVNEFKRLARELEIPVLALSSMNRSARDRNTAEPRLSDLGDSGAIETTSDVVHLLHRPEMFDADEEKGKAQIIVAKQNLGPTGSIPLTFIADWSTFAPYSGRDSDGF